MGVPPSTMLLVLLGVGAVTSVVAGMWGRFATDQASEPLGNGRRINGDIVYADERVNELLYANPPQYDAGDVPFDPDDVQTTICDECDTLNRREYTYCRDCGTDLD